MSMPTRSLRRNALSVFVQFALPAMLGVSAAHAATCTVNSALDDPADASAKVSGVDPLTWTNWGAGATGAISLRDCILAANLMTGATGAPTSPGMTIALTAIAGSTITLADSLPMIFNNATVTGTGSPVTIDGAGAHRIFFVSGLPDSNVNPPPDPDGAQAISVGLGNVVLQNGKAQGGGGHAGGLGAGGALFVNKNATVSFAGDIKTNSAAGGTGGVGTNNYGGGGMGGSAGARGGGGIGGSNVSAGFSFGGGIGTDSASGGGGGFGGTGVGQLSSVQGFTAPAFGGASTFAAPNGGIGGGGYRYGAGGFGGGGGANSAGTPTSPGGFGGGGGAPGEGGGSAGGGFGGGAGAMGFSASFGYNAAGGTGVTGAIGGFGAGGAGGGAGGGCSVGPSGPTGSYAGGAGGAGGPGGIGGGIGAVGSVGTGCSPGSPGANGSNGSGGGGGGLGGGVFVRAGGTLVVFSGPSGSVVSGNTVTAGTGGPTGPTGAVSPGGDGAAAGNGLFLMGGATTTFNVGATETITDNIQDDSVASLPGTSYTVGSGGGAAITKSGTGTLVFAGINTYTGPTTIDAGTLQLDGVLTASPITINAGGTLSGTGIASQPVSLGSGAIVAPGDSPGTLRANGLTWDGDSGGNAQMNFQLGPTGSGDSDELDLSFGFNKGSTGTYKFHFTDGSGGPPTPGTVYTLVRYSSTSFTLDASDFSFDYAGAYAGSFQGTFALTGSASPPGAPFANAPTAALPPNALTFTAAVAPLAPTITKAFGAGSIPLNGTTTLSFHINNPNAGTALSGIAFSDSLPAGLAVGATPGATNTCSGTFTPAANDTSLSLSGGTLAANASCDISVNVTGSTAGQKNNTTGVISASGAAAGATSNTALLTVVGPPIFQKGFAPNAIGPAGTSTLTFSISNINSVALTGLAFTDTFPAGLVVAAAPNASDTCGGAFTATAGAGSVDLSGGTVSANTACSLHVDVQATSTGVKDNMTGAISSTEGGTGGTASASLTVNLTPVRLQSFEVE